MTYFAYNSSKLIIVKSLIPCIPGTILTTLQSLSHMIPKAGVSMDTIPKSISTDEVTEAWKCWVAKFLQFVSKKVRIWAPKSNSIPVPYLRTVGWEGLGFVLAWQEWVVFIRTWHGSKITYLPQLTMGDIPINPSFNPNWKYDPSKMHLITHNLPNFIV